MDKSLHGKSSSVFTSSSPNLSEATASLLQNSVDMNYIDRVSKNESQRDETSKTALPTIPIRKYTTPPISYEKMSEISTLPNLRPSKLLSSSPSKSDNITNKPTNEILNRQMKPTAIITSEHLSQMKSEASQKELTISSTSGKPVKIPPIFSSIDNKHSQEIHNVTPVKKVSQQSILTNNRTKTMNLQQKNDPHIVEGDISTSSSTDSHIHTLEVSIPQKTLKLPHNHLQTTVSSPSLTSSISTQNRYKSSLSSSANSYTGNGNPPTLKNQPSRYSSGSYTDINNEPGTSSSSSHITSKHIENQRETEEESFLVLSPRSQMKTFVTSPSKAKLLRLPPPPIIRGKPRSSSMSSVSIPSISTETITVKEDQMVSKSKPNRLDDENASNSSKGIPVKKSVNTFSSPSDSTLTKSSNDMHKTKTLPKPPEIIHGNIGIVPPSTTIDDNHKKLENVDESDLFLYFVCVDLHRSSTPIQPNNSASNTSTASSSTRLQPQIIYQYPEEGEHSELLNSVPSFCYPDIDIIDRQYLIAKINSTPLLASSRTFHFVLTDVTGKRRFGYCRRVNLKSENYPVTFCLVTSQYVFFFLFVFAIYDSPRRIY